MDNRERAREADEIIEAVYQELGEKRGVLMGTYNRIIKWREARAAIEGDLKPSVSEGRLRDASQAAITIDQRAPRCPTHGEWMILSFYDRPGSPPGNGWACRSCARERAALAATQEPQPPQTDGIEGMLTAAIVLAEVGEIPAKVTIQRWRAALFAAAGAPAASGREAAFEEAAKLVIAKAATQYGNLSVNQVQEVVQEIRARATAPARWCDVCNAPFEVEQGEHVCGLTAAQAYSLGWRRGNNEPAREREAPPAPRPELAPAPMRELFEQTPGKRNLNYLDDLRHDLHDEEFRFQYLSACAMDGGDSLRIGIRDVLKALAEREARPELAPRDAWLAKHGGVCPCCQNAESVVSDKGRVHCPYCVTGELTWMREAPPDLAGALGEFTPIIEAHLKREMTAPANHQEFQREAADKLDRWRALAQLKVQR